MTVFAKSQPALVEVRLKVALGARIMPRMEPEVLRVVALGTFQTMDLAMASPAAVVWSEPT